MPWVRSTVFSVDAASRSEEHTSELQSHSDLVCRLLLENKRVPIQRCTNRPSDRLATGRTWLAEQRYLPATNRRTRTRIAGIADVASVVLGCRAGDVQRAERCRSVAATRHPKRQCDSAPVEDGMDRPLSGPRVGRFYNASRAAHIFPRSRRVALFFFFKVHAPHRHSPFYPTRRLPD